ncbi:mitochondrial 37S ribosomal protein rsm10 [Pleurotus pulmonarius]|nr:mitochondrial 37S ribosomal protein rsm10 [Pleurotus pulmonarius]
MLRVAFRAPIRATTVSFRSWQRFNSTQLPSATKLGSAPSTSGAKPGAAAAPIGRGEESLVSGITNDLSDGLLSDANESIEDDEEAIDESLLFASETEPTQPATSEEELFGTRTSGSSTTDQLDSDSLPRPYSSLPANPTEAEYASALIHGRSIHLPYYHPRTHDIPAASIQFRSHHPRLLDLFTHFASHAASSLGIPVSRVAYLPTQRSLWTVPRSPFAHKKSQENFERRVHKRAIKAFDADPEVVDRWTRYLRRHALAGVGMRVVKWERMPLSVGADRLLSAMSGLNQSAVNKEKIKQLGDKIVRQEMAVLEKDAEQNR